MVFVGSDMSTVPKIVQNIYLIYILASLYDSRTKPWKMIDPVIDANYIFSTSFVSRYTNRLWRNIDISDPWLNLPTNATSCGTTADFGICGNSMEDETDESWTRGGSCGMFARCNSTVNIRRKHLKSRIAFQTCPQRGWQCSKMPVAAVKVAATELTRIHIPRSNYAKAPCLK